MSSYILGISCFFHDSAACLLKDGEIVAAAHEERFTRVKHDASFPREAIFYCLSEAGISEAELDYVAFYEKPVVKFDRILQTSLRAAPLGIKPFMMAMPKWLKERLWMTTVLEKELPRFSGEFIFPTHHESHSASAFFASPFQEAAILTLDAVGEWNTTTYGVGNGNTIELLESVDFPHSLGMLYSAFTYYCGFKVNSGEYKLMGLAPYGKPRYADTIKEHLISIKPDGSFRLAMEYFGYDTGLYMTNQRFHNLFGGRAPRKPDEPIAQFHMDLAASIQQVTEEVILAIAQYVKEQTGKRYLCLAGGVALNCVANGALKQAGIFDNIWIQPAAGDAGGALGAALFTWYQHLEKPRVADGEHDAMQGAYLGPQYDAATIEALLKEKGAVYEKLSEEQLIARTADLIAEGKVIGWFQGRMEYGPRALGARSILGDARNREMQRRMNVKIKFRESFRPFAPSVLEEKVDEWFEKGDTSPYMLITYYVSPKHRKRVAEEIEGLEKVNQVRSDIPAVTHVDYSARVQTVSKETNPWYHKLISAFADKTGCPVIINTSFNVRGEPIVCTPEDAWYCFQNTNMDYLVIGDYLVEKQEFKDEEEMEEWASHFVMD